MPDDKSRRCASFNHGIPESLRISRTLRGVITICHDRHFLAWTMRCVLYRRKNLNDWRRFILDRSIGDKREAKQTCNKEIANTTVIYALLY